MCDNCPSLIVDEIECEFCGYMNEGGEDAPLVCIKCRVPLEREEPSDDFDESVEWQDLPWGGDEDYGGGGFFD